MSHPMTRLEDPSHPTSSHNSKVRLSTLFFILDATNSSRKRDYRRGSLPQHRLRYVPLAYRLLCYLFWFSCKALDFRRWLGGEKLINDYCRDLAIRGGKLLAELFGTSLLDPSGELTLNMVSPPSQQTWVIHWMLYDCFQVDVELPLEGVAPSDELSKRLMESMLFDFNACTAHYYLDGKWWVRCSAQIFNEVRSRTLLHIIISASIATF